MFPCILRLEIFGRWGHSSSSLLLSSLELSDAKVYESEIRALFGTASHFCEVVVLELRTVPIGTALSLRWSHLVLLN